MLLDGGTAPAVNGDDDETTLAGAAGAAGRAAQLKQERAARRTTSPRPGGAYARAPARSTGVQLTRRRAHLPRPTPLERLRILAALTSNVSLNAARTIASRADRNISDLIDDPGRARASPGCSPRCSSRWA